MASKRPSKNLVQTSNVSDDNPGLRKLSTIIRQSVRKGYMSPHRPYKSLIAETRTSNASVESPVLRKRARIVFAVRKWVKTTKTTTNSSVQGTNNQNTGAKSAGNLKQSENSDGIQSDGAKNIRTRTTRQKRSVDETSKFLVKLKKDLHKIESQEYFDEIQQKMLTTMWNKIETNNC